MKKKGFPENRRMGLRSRIKGSFLATWGLRRERNVITIALDGMKRNENGS